MAPDPGTVADLTAVSNARRPVPVQDGARPAGKASEPAARLQAAVDRQDQVLANAPGARDGGQAFVAHVRDEFDRRAAVRWNSDRMSWKARVDAAVSGPPSWITTHVERAERGPIEPSAHPVAERAFRDLVLGGLPQALFPAVPMRSPVSRVEAAVFAMGVP